MGIQQKKHLTLSMIILTMFFSFFILTSKQTVMAMQKTSKISAGGNIMVPIVLFVIFLFIGVFIFIKFKDFF